MIVDINNLNNGLYRSNKDNNFRFFRIYRNQNKVLKIKEFKNGDLHQILNKYEGDEAINFLNQIENLEHWQ